jgi:hypothetical protein
VMRIGDAVSSADGRAHFILPERDGKHAAERGKSWLLLLAGKGVSLRPLGRRSVTGEVLRMGANCGKL